MSRSGFSPRNARCRRAVTIAELVVALAIVAVLVALAVPAVARQADRIAVRSAVGDLEAQFALARELAISRRSGVAVRLDSLAGTARIEASGYALRVRDLRKVYGVRLAATRDSMAYDGRGLGHGAANLRVVVERGEATETLFVARLGRVRRSAEPRLP